MKYNWNVYKIFNNGKRAKAPMSNFNCSTQEMRDGYFEKNIKKDLIKEFGPKIKENKFSILRSDGSQEQNTEENPDKTNNRLRYRVFVKCLKEKDIKEKMIECVLLFSPSTNWNWQWCVVHMGTTRVLETISPAVNSHEEAQRWMEEKILEL